MKSPFKWNKVKLLILIQNSENITLIRRKLNLYQTYGVIFNLAGCCPKSELRLAFFSNKTAGKDLLLSSQFRLSQKNYFSP